MNEVTGLSEELKIHGVKIKMSKNRIGQESIEIGRELTEAKEKCKHGEWLLFLEQECEISDSYAQKIMKIYREFSNAELIPHLGVQALHFLTTLSDEQKEQPHELTTGTKTIYEMNQQEVNELKRQLAQAQKSEKIALKNLEAAENKKPEIVEKVVSVIPKNLQKKYEDMENKFETSKQRLKELEEENKILKIRKNGSVDNDEQEKQREKALKQQANISTYELIIEINEFLKKSVLSSYKIGAIANTESEVKEEIREAVKMLEDFVKNLKVGIEGRIQI